jgi:hypothetical protein
METWEKALKESSRKLNLAQERIAKSLFETKDFELEQIEKKYESIKSNN